MLACPCYGVLLLGVILAVTRDYILPLSDICLPCDAYILGESSGCFSGFFWMDWSFGLGAARTPFSNNSSYIIDSHLSNYIGMLQ